MSMGMRTARQVCRSSLRLVPQSSHWAPTTTATARNWRQSTRVYNYHCSCTRTSSSSNKFSPFNSLSNQCPTPRLFSTSVSIQRQHSTSSSPLRYLATHLDTIYALSTHPGKAGVAMIRVSGPKSSDILLKLSQRSILPKPRMAVTRKLRCPVSNDLLDNSLVIWFPGPNSFTGQDIVEFHCHGGKAVVDGILKAISQVEVEVRTGNEDDDNDNGTIRMAEPGEFARRAFENDKLDLTEVEGLNDLLNAETEAQRRLALRQADGGLKNLYEGWRKELIESMALIEALIDFGEDENIEEDVYDNVLIKIQKLYNEIQFHMNDGRRGEILRDGIHVAIVGPPNAGKSSFLNWITKRQASIVSPIPGTTRDVVEVSLDIGGFPVIIGDTAGLRSSLDPIEMEGVKRAKHRMEQADINIVMVPVVDLENPGEELQEIVKSAIMKGDDENTMVLINKMDLSTTDGSKSEGDLLQTLRSRLGLMDDISKKKVWPLSCQSGQGIDIFLQDFVKILQKRFDSTVVGSTSITQHRHRAHLEDCVYFLETFLELGPEDVVLGAEELRHAASELGKITGRVDVEDVLDVIFREFCIGK